MKRDETHTRISFLCAGCLRSKDVVVPTTNDIANDFGTAKERIMAEGWTIQKIGHDTVYYCIRCSNKDGPTSQRGFVQSTFQ